MQKLLFLQRQQSIERDRVAADEFRDLREFQPDTFEGDHLMQSQNFDGAIDTPARRSPRGADKTVTLIDAERAHGKAEAAGRFCGCVLGI
jgi:hypothetical protein